MHESDAMGSFRVLPALVRVRRAPTSRVPRPAVPSPSRARALSARVAVRRSSFVARASSHGLASSAPPTARFDWRAVVIVTRAHLLSPHSSPSPLSLALSLALSRSLSRACVRPTATVERSAFELDRARETAERRAEDRPRW